MATIKLPLADEKSRDDKHGDTDFVYYNIDIRSDPSTEQPTLAQYSISRLAPILHKPDDYELAVTRFYLPASEIPIMIWNPRGKTLSDPYQPNPDLPGYNPASKVDKFVVSMSYNLDPDTDPNNYVQKPLVFPPNYNTSFTDIYGDSIQSYGEFFDILNKALFDAFTDLKATPWGGGAPPTEAPYIQFDSTTNLCTFVAQTSYDTGNGIVPPPATIQVYFNDPLQQLFTSFLAFYQGGFFLNGVGAKVPYPEFDYQVLIRDVRNNTVTTGTSPPYYYMEQEYSTLGLFNDFQAIVFATDQIPASPEYEPGVGDSQRVLTDFIPDVAINDRQAFVYFGLGWKRYYDLTSKYPLRNIDMRAYWRDVNGILYPIYLSGDEQLSMKLLFRKKAKRKNK
jgi:hypothetical protein